MSSLEIKQIPTRTDNYVYLIRDTASGKAGVIDPSDAAPVLEALERLGWELTLILATHHHNDHIGGNLEIKEKTGCTIVGPRADRERIPGIDVAVGDGDSFLFHGCEARVFDTPGHTRGHIAYWFPETGALFCGDTLFALGCGRLFEGTAEQMWDSLSKFRELPDDTLVYCAHEYTQANAGFALTIEPDNAALKARALEIDALRDAGKPTVPSRLGEERATNPFLRAAADELRHAIGMDDADPVAVFAEVRKRKDNF
jgi:hydroxyacylglutathione hydrolase